MISCCLFLERYLGANVTHVQFVTLFKNYIAFFLCLNNKARNKVVVGITKSKCRKCQKIFLQIVADFL